MWRHPFPSPDRSRRSTHAGVFFFQAEDGIRDDLVTGVQTCALPIYTNQYIAAGGTFNWHTRVASFRFPSCALAPSTTGLTTSPNPSTGGPVTLTARSEERRVGKECRSRGSPDH